MRRTPLLLAVATCLLFACGRPPTPAPLRVAPPPPPPPVAAPTPPPAPTEAPPTGRLPTHTRPLRYVLSLEVVPERATFAGSVAIDVELAERRDVLWLHGVGLSSKQSAVLVDGRVVPARFEASAAEGVVGLFPEAPVGPGRVTVRIDYEAAFGTSPRGLFHTRVDGSDYAFTQLEPTWARYVMPCFDEPAWKTPIELSLFVPAGQTAAANAPLVKREPVEGGLERVTFAPTEPLPTYLLALAVGPLDVVDAPPVAASAVRPTPLPLRGLAVKGQGPKLRYALERTPAILGALERYFGSPYPFAKLDVVAVPDMGGAMENAGLVTFRDWLLLVDEKNAPFEQRRAFAGVMTHELAHQWFGDLVTMPWWDDIWLNEAFATWMTPRVVSELYPELDAGTSGLAGVLGAMDMDALVSARRIREPIQDGNDIENAFDSITYQKGSGTLAMFERWMGPDVFQKGLREYLGAHRYGNATSDDLLAALGAASGKDVAGAMGTFLQQPGVPAIDAKLVCGDKPTLHLTQTRFLPLGSKGQADHTWRVPVCARYGEGKTVRTSCTLLAAREGDLPLEGKCPTWVLPNEGGAGYYRFGLSSNDLAALLEKGLGALSAPERLALASSVEAGMARGTLKVSEVLEAATRFAADPHPLVAAMPMRLLERARSWFDDPPARLAIERLGRKLYAPRLAALGWAAKDPKGETSETAALRVKVLSFLAFVANEPGVRDEARRLGRAYVGAGGDGALHPEAVAPDLASLAIGVAMQDADAELFDHVQKLAFAASEPAVRARLLGSLGRARRPELATRARALALAPETRASETFETLGTQLSDPDLRDDAWAYVTQELSGLSAKLPPRRAGGLPWTATVFCDEEHAAAVEALFAPRIEQLLGGKRNLSGALEALHLCAAQRKEHEGPLRAALISR